MLLRAGLALALAVVAGCGGQDPPQYVIVPEHDATPPLAILRLDPGGGAPAVVHRSPVGARRAPAVRLAKPELRATAVIRDPDGGTGRIRLTVHFRARCDGRVRMRTVNLPPSQIVRIRLTPGTRAPVERRRTGRVPLPRGCEVTGEAFADATNASGLESFSDPVRFVTSPKASGDEGARSPGRRNPISGVVVRERGRPSARGRGVRGPR